MDEDDFPLSKGAAFFADEEAFAAYQEELGPLGPEVGKLHAALVRYVLTFARQPSTCHQFGAMGYGPHWGKVSGTVGVFCARHMVALPGGQVDLQKGERCVKALVILTPSLTMRATGSKTWTLLSYLASSDGWTC